MIKGKITHLPKKEAPMLKRKKVKKEDRNVRATMIDTHMYQDSIDDVKAVRKKLYSNINNNEFVEQLTEDLFHCLYKTFPEVNNIGDVVEENRLSHEVLTQLIDSEEFDQLRNNTVANLFNSTLSLSSVQNQAVKVINEYMEKNKQMKELLENINKAKQARNKMEQQEKQDGAPNPKTQKELQDLLDRINNGKDDLQFDLGDMMGDIAQGLGETSQMVKDVNDLLDGFGGADDAAVRKMSYEDKLSLADNIKTSNKFKKVCDFVGRMTKMVNKVGKKPSPYGHAIGDIGLGNNISKVLNSEKVKLTDGDLENDFLKKYINKGLLEFKTDGSEDGKGPMVICLDESGSMDAHNREEWSKAFCIACIQIAHKQRRNCKIITFSSSLGTEFEFDKKKIDAKKLLEFTEYFRDGGTNFDLPMSEAVRTVTGDKYRKADIMFVTDGDPNRNVNEDLQKEIKLLKETKGLRIQAVLIGNNVKESAVKVFADTIVRVSNVDQDEVMVNVFDNIQR